MIDNDKPSGDAMSAITSIKPLPPPPPPPPPKRDRRRIKDPEQSWRRVLRYAVVAASVAMLLVGSCGPARLSAEEVRLVIVNPGVPAAGFWPSDEIGPAILRSVFEWRLTSDYWAAIAECERTASPKRCRATVPAQYSVTRVE